MYNTIKILNGVLELKGDKSISHRLLMICSLINNESKLSNISTCNDVHATIECLKKCNIKIDYNDDNIYLRGGTFKNPHSVLDCQNSGTTLRILMGLLFGQSIEASFSGDRSLKRRPFDRVMDPLIDMGAKFEFNKDIFPIKMSINKNKSIHYMSEIKSAQVTSAIIFASLGSNNWSSISYNKFSRNHTERIMENLGFNILIDNNIKVKKSTIKKGISVHVPGDISSASFIIAAAILLPESHITVKNVLYNKTRLEFINVLCDMGAKIEVANIQDMGCGIKSCDIVAEYSSDIKSVNIKSNQVISMIDEIPIFCVVASFAKGITIIEDAKELRLKECDRINAIYENLNKMSGNIWINGDSLKINGDKKLYNTNIKHYNDHRIAMSFEIMKLVIGERMTYEYSDIIDVSFPNFYRTIDSLLI